MMDLSAGETVREPWGLRQIPGNLRPSLSSLMRPNRANFRPEHLFGSHWKKNIFFTFCVFFKG
jgi:hypothetical protein